MQVEGASMERHDCSCHHDDPRKSGPWNAAVADSSRNGQAPEDAEACAHNPEPQQFDLDTPPVSPTLALSPHRLGHQPLIPRRRSLGSRCSAIFGFDWSDIKLLERQRARKASRAGILEEKEESGDLQQEGSPVEKDGEDCDDVEGFGSLSRLIQRIDEQCHGSEATLMELSSSVEHLHGDVAELKACQDSLEIAVCRAAEVSMGRHRRRLLQEELAEAGILPGGFCRGETVFAELTERGNVEFWQNLQRNYEERPLLVVSSGEQRRLQVACPAFDTLLEVESRRVTRAPPAAQKCLAAVRSCESIA